MPNDPPSRIKRNGVVDIGPGVLPDNLAGVIGEPDWAHVSGWTQLSGLRRTVTVIVPTLDEIGLLTTAVPVLSDLLTEYGFPWEVLFVDHGSRDGSAEQIERWARLPGYRGLHVRASPDSGMGVVTALGLARGDVVCLFAPGRFRMLGLLPEMLMRWEQGAWIVHLHQPAQAEREILVHWGEDVVLPWLQQYGFDVPPACRDFGLLDYRVVDRILSAPA